jgi:hypothetical protein
MINRLAKEDKIGILCVQETHLTNKHEKQIETLFSKRLLVLNSSDTNCPGNLARVAFIINKEKLNVSNAKMMVLIPGRAITLMLKWHKEKIINILNIYALNNHAEHQSFWNMVQTQWNLHRLGLIDFMMGDFNLTEDPLDCAPARPDNENAVEFSTSLSL